MQSTNGDLCGDVGAADDLGSHEGLVCVSFPAQCHQTWHLYGSYFGVVWLGWCWSGVVRMVLEWCGKDGVGVMWLGWCWSGMLKVVVEVV